MALMPMTWSFDVDAWMEVARVMREGGNPYSETDLLHYAPLWPAFLRALDMLSQQTGWHFVHGLQGLLIVTDAANLIISRGLLKRSGVTRTAHNALIAVLVLSPISILLTVQHGNFDALVATWLLLFVGALWDHSRAGSGRSWLLAALFLGLGVLTKTVPLLLVPLLLIGVKQRSMSINALGAVLVVAPFVLSLLPIWMTDPESVARHVIAYRSLPGWFGITGLLDLAGMNGAMWTYARTGPISLLLLMAAASWYVLKQAGLSKSELVRLSLWLMLGLLILGPGYSPQYIAWLLPLSVLHVAFSEVSERRWLLATYLIATLTYLVEYAIIPDHGAFLLLWSHADGIPQCSEALKSPGGQTMLRLPLFLVYTVLFLRWSRAIFLPLLVRDRD